jgi:hypothetical protein
MSFQSIPDATTAIKGKASFNSANFAVTSGDVTIKAAGVPPGALATGAAKGDVATSQTTTSTTYTGLTTAQTLSVTVGANGLLLVGVGCDMTNNTGDAFCWMSFALSGANTLASADTNAVMHQTQGAGHQQAASRVTLLTGLSTGSTTLTAQFRVQTGGGGAGTGTFVNRTMWAVPL